MSYYEFHRRTHKWTTAFHYYMLNLVVSSAYILYTTYCKERNTRSMTHYDFRCELVEDLLHYELASRLADGDIQSRITRSTKLARRLDDNCDD